MQMFLSRAEVFTDFCTTGRQGRGCIQYDTGRFWICSCRSEDKCVNIHPAFHGSLCHRRDPSLWVRTNKKVENKPKLVRCETGKTPVHSQV